jgi:hypothetical protein
MAGARARLLASAFQINVKNYRCDQGYGATGDDPDGPSGGATIRRRNLKTYETADREHRKSDGNTDDQIKHAAPGSAAGARRISR